MASVCCRAKRSLYSNMYPTSRTELYKIRSLNHCIFTVSKVSVKKDCFTERGVNTLSRPENQAAETRLINAYAARCLNQVENSRSRKEYLRPKSSKNGVAKAHGNQINSKPMNVSDRVQASFIPFTRMKM